MSISLSVSTTLREQVLAANWEKVDRLLQDHVQEISPGRMEWILYQASRQNKGDLIEEWLKNKKTKPPLNSILSICENIGQIFTGLDNINMRDKDWEHLFLFLNQAASQIEPRNTEDLERYDCLICDLIERAFKLRRLDLLKKLASLPYAFEIKYPLSSIPSGYLFLDALKNHQQDFKELNKLWSAKISSDIRSAARAGNWDEVRSFLKADAPLLSCERLAWLLEVSCRYAQIDLIDFLSTLFTADQHTTLLTICERLGKITTSVEFAKISPDEWAGLIHLIKYMESYIAQTDREKNDSMQHLLEELVVRAFSHCQLDIFKQLALLKSFSLIEILDFPSKDKKYAPKLLAILKAKDWTALQDLHQNYSEEKTLEVAAAFARAGDKMIQFFKPLEPIKKIPTKMSSIAVYSFDFDGCLANKKYDNAFNELSKSNAEINQASILSTFVKANAKLVESIKTKQQKIASLEGSMVFCGSLRQSLNIEFINAKEKKSSIHPCSFLAVEALSKALGAEFNPLLMADIFFKQEPGTTFNTAKQIEAQVTETGSSIFSGRILRYVNYLKAHNNEFHYYADKGKMSILFLQMWDVALRYPEQKIEFNFYDDLEPLLKGLATFYANSPQLIPANVLLNLNQYKDGETPQPYFQIQGTKAMNIEIDHYQTTQWILQKAQEREKSNKQFVLAYDKKNNVHLLLQDQEIVFSFKKAKTAEEKRQYAAAEEKAEGMLSMKAS